MAHRVTKATTGIRLRAATAAMVHKVVMATARKTVTMADRVAMVIREIMALHRRAVA